MSVWWGLRFPAGCRYQTNIVTGTIGAALMLAVKFFLLFFVELTPLARVKGLLSNTGWMMGGVPWIHAPPQLLHPRMHCVDGLGDRHGCMRTQDDGLQRVIHAFASILAALDVFPNSWLFVPQSVWAIVFNILNGLGNCGTYWRNPTPSESFTDGVLLVMWRWSPCYFSVNTNTDHSLKQEPSLQSMGQFTKYVELKFVLLHSIKSLFFFFHTTLNWIQIPMLGTAATSWCK